MIFALKFFYTVTIRWYNVVGVLITDVSAFLAFEVLQLASDERGGSFIKAVSRICYITMNGTRIKNFAALSVSLF